MGAYSQEEPEAPNMAGANEAGVWADAETLAIKKMINNAAKFGKKIDLRVPTFDGAGNKTGFKDVTYDFKGFSDEDSTRADMDFAAESADKMAKTMLDVQKKYGKDYVKQRMEELKAADPTGYEIREMLGDDAKRGLMAGGRLSPEMDKQVEEAEQYAQTSRGNVYGTAAVASEAMSKGYAGLALKQQNLANAASFLSGNTPINQIGALSGAQAGASPFNPVGIQSGLALDPNAGARGESYMMSGYNTRMNYAANQQPIGAQLLGLATGVATGKITDKLLA